jgi:hypothetical protein
MLDASLDFFVRLFNDRMRLDKDGEKRQIYIQFTTATDTKIIFKLLECVRDAIISKELQDYKLV